MTEANFVVDGEVISVVIAKTEDKQNQTDAVQFQGEYPQADQAV